MNGYSEKLIELDDRMVALGRPVPPAFRWLASKRKHLAPSKDGNATRGEWNRLTAEWREQLATWERDHPQDAVDWHELREQYRLEEEILESRKWNEDQWHYERLTRIGAPLGSVDAIRRKLDDRACFRSTRDWMLEASWCLVLTGGPGCGKTTAAAWATHQLMMRRFKPRWVRCAAMVDAPMFGIEAQLVKVQCRAADVLVLDDIGAGAREKDAKPWLGWLDDVLDARWAQKRKTIITSNQRTDALATWLGPRLADRLNEGTIHSTSEPSMRGRKREPGDDDDDPRRRELYP